jgi:hypothetical protein
MDVWDKTMKKEVVELIEAARGLEIRLSPDSERPVNVGGDRESFPHRLKRVALALEAVDKTGSEALELEDGDPSMDVARLRVALDGVFRWMRSSGVDVSEPYKVVANALGVASGEPEQQKTSGKGYRPIPKFAHSGFGKKKSGSNGVGGVKVRLAPKLDEKTSLEGLKGRNRQMEGIETTLGDAAPSRRR